MFSQTIAPIHNQHQTKAGKTVHGSYQVQNNSLIPQPLTLEPTELFLDAHGTHRGPLPDTIKVKLSTTSARLSPKQIMQIDYAISCAVLPCNIAITNVFTVGKTADGLEVRLVLPFSIYLGTTKTPRADAVKAAGMTESPIIAVK